MSLLKFGFSTSKAQSPHTSGAAKLSENRQIKKQDYEKNKRDRKFRDSWKNDFTWLDHNEEENKMFCTLCKSFPLLADTSSRFYTGNDSFRIHHVQSHGQSYHHARCLAAQNARDRPNDAPLNAQVIRMEAGQRDKLVHVFDLG